MARSAIRPTGSDTTVLAAVVVGGIALLGATIGLSQTLSADPGDMLTRNTVRLSLAWYAMALCLMMRLDPQGWRAETSLGRLARLAWTWSIVCFWIHLGMAFHFYHHWSHAHAFAHTREVSGVGEGIYISYFFTWLWTADMLWWWLAPARYAARPAWIDRALHGFMLFIVFNGMVVYEPGLIRWVGLVLFAGLAVAWVMARGFPRLRTT